MKIFKTLKTLSICLLSAATFAFGAGASAVFADEDALQDNTDQEQTQESETSGDAAGDTTGDATGDTTGDTTNNTTGDTTAETSAIYPDDFSEKLSFDGEIKDFAVCGDTYAFAYNGRLSVLYENAKGEKQHALYTKYSGISNLDFCDADSDGEAELLIIYEDKDVYSVYPDLETTLSLSDLEYQSPQKSFHLSGVGDYYNINSENKLYYMPSGGDPITVSADGSNAGFSALKQYDGDVYALCNNGLYILDGSSATAVDLTYFDYKAASEIAADAALSALKADGYVIKTAWLKAESYYTQIDLENTTSGYFALPSDLSIEECTVKQDDKIHCLILCEAGNASVIAISGKCYITRTDSLDEVSEQTLQTSAKTTAYALTSIGVYSSPYISSATKIATLESGSQNRVTVLGQYDEEMSDTLFAKITYEKDGATVTGYVADGLLTVYSFSSGEEGENNVGDTEFEYGTNVVTVVIVCLIVLLVLIAIVYVAAVYAKRKSENKRRHTDYDEE